MRFIACLTRLQFNVLTLRLCFTGLCVLLLACAVVAPSNAQALKRRALTGRNVAVVVDERLAVLRSEPTLSAPLTQRLRRGRMVTIIGTRRTADSVTFHRVALTRRTRGWLQAESIASPFRAGDDVRLLNLIRASEEFDRIARASIFLDAFTNSPLRPAVLMLYGEAAEASAEKLSREAQRRLDDGEMRANGAPAHSYFLNYAGLDRFNRAGIKFTFDRATKRFHYDGASWREIIRRHPRSAESAPARQRLESLSVGPIR
ncbi:MAG: hypothetical protein H0W76_17315 [Pyrinomonadaceae bacterium]|nr:hypothetical protein [Pyrinomonadaceae bacterium]